MAVRNGLVLFEYDQLTHGNVELSAYSPIRGVVQISVRVDSHYCAAHLGFCDAHRLSCWLRDWANSQRDVAEEDAT